MHDCWPALLGCLVAGGLSATLNLVLADLLQVWRELSIDSETFAVLGWTVAALLWLRLRIERARRSARALDPDHPMPPSPYTDAGADRPGND
jgi:uncharacterized membrane protein YciS (DUF1049 family)